MPSSDELKDEGNKAFISKEYKKAAKIYRDAIQLDMYNPTLYSNRAQCFLNLQDYERALKDAISGLNLGASKQLSVKLTYRKAMALIGLQRWQSAKEAFEQVLNLDPSNQSAKFELAKLQTKKSVKSNKEGIIPIHKVDKLPDRFEEMLNPKSKVTAQNNTTTKQPQQTSAELEKEMNELFGESKTTTEPEIEETNLTKPPLEESSPMQLLNALKYLPSAQKINGYKYVLNLDQLSYTKLFSESGIDTEFLNFFLDASQYALQDELVPNPNQVVLSHLKLFQTFKRYGLAILMCDEDVKKSILEIVSNKYSQDLNLYTKLIQ
ncbi:hypothetical protein KGF54_004103 [Candida jiufengensis]|uniref:uncharacterized protein n=1 Tax=Candida jiufengensis TaxID=497108 RepID=UPI002224BA6C|nr:uncharacterized protein KGF54_004103 [Candida jiufengensis]KAI5951029.1 hypothetical protein KGF54_004103 [Candida jiufengensis]